MIIGALHDFCAYPHCRRRITADAVYCKPHQCDCVAKNTGAEYRLHVIWGRVHSLNTYDFDDALLNTLHLSSIKLGSTHCPCTYAFGVCMAPLVPFCKTSPQCSRLFVEPGEHTLCPACRGVNRCGGKVFNHYGALAQCANGTDYTDPMRFALGLCRSQKCNVKVRCARNPACMSIVFVNQLNGATVRSPLCDKCEKTHCLCRSCGRVAESRKSILFSKYAYQNHTNPRPNLCILCTTHDLGALALQWWLFKPKFDWWLKAWMLGADFTEHAAQYLLWNWALFTPDQLALFLRPVDCGSSLSYAARYKPIPDSIGETMYRLVSLPGDLFRIILRMLNTPLQRVIHPIAAH